MLAFYYRENALPVTDSKIEPCFAYVFCFGVISSVYQNSQRDAPTVGGFEGGFFESGSAASLGVLERCTPYA
ncbi:MAG: hypothetical protein ACU83P_11170, partial [Gammaproteobacteria bacterium]